jgi:hypothetical protein
MVCCFGPGAIGASGLFLFKGLAFLRRFLFFTNQFENAPKLSGNSRRKV